jgi:hypothetical protein
VRDKAFCRLGGREIEVWLHRTELSRLPKCRISPLQANVSVKRIFKAFAAFDVVAIDVSRFPPHAAVLHFPSNSDCNLAYRGSFLCFQSEIFI